MDNARLWFAEGGDPLSVRHFHVEESMSGLFAVTVMARSPFDSLDLSRYVGEPAELWLAGTPERRWRGLCVRMRVLSTPGTAESLSTYEVVIAPTLWKLTQRRGNRLFQHVSIPAIVSRLLREWGVEHRLRIEPTRYPPLELRTQYDETDFAFFSRLLEEAGISYYFVDPEEEGRDALLVLDDGPQTNARRALPLPWVDDESVALAAGVEHVTKLVLEEETRPGTVTLRDYDPRRPRAALFAGAAGERAAEAAYEQYHFAPGAFLREKERAAGPSAPGASELAAAALGGTSAGALAVQAVEALVAGETPVADDMGAARFAQKRGEDLAAQMIEAIDAGRSRVTFETTAHDLRPGVVLSVTGHPRADLGPERHLLMTRFVIDGDVSVPKKWLFQGTAVFAARPHRPARVTPKPRMFGVQTAVVVGPSDPTAGDIAGTAASVAAQVSSLSRAAGATAEAAAAAARLVDNDIYVDELGRVRVQLPWDREGRFDSASSIWMRVSQGWAGGGYGLFTIPRVGHEVLVAFLDGDPDCPLVVGRVHNLVEPVPFKLPENKTVSTWKTASSPGGDGFNELRFDDAAGREHLYLQAQKDMDHLVKNDLKQAVGRDRSRSVQNNESIAVGHDRVKIVNHDEVEATGLNRAEVVGLSRASTIGVEDSTHVGTRWSVTVARGLTSRLAREVDQIAGGPLGGVLRSAASTVLGLIPSTPLARAAEATLADLGGAAIGRLKNVLSVLDGFETDPGPAPTTIEVVDRQIKLSTGEAAIILDGPNVTITAQGSITFHAMKSVSVLAEEEAAVAAREKAAVISLTDDVIVQAKSNVHLNPYDSTARPARAERLAGGAPDPTPRCSVCGDELEDGKCPNAEELPDGDA